MDNLELYKEKAKAKLQELDARIDLLKAQAASKKADAGIDANKHLEDLRKKREHFSSRMNAMREAGADAGEELRIGFDNMMRDAQEALDRAGRSLEKAK